jgi:hypothetical protein
MSIQYSHNSVIQFALESLPEYPSIRERFLSGFNSLVLDKKHEAVQQALPTEINNTVLLHCPSFKAAVIKQLDNEALLEKPYIFISLNAKTLL